MAFNIPDTYKDQSPAEQLDQKTLNKMVWRSLFLQASFNYERMQSGGWLYGLLPGLKKIHKDKDDLAASMSHNLEFFNTHPFLVTFVMGIVLSMEQNKTDIPTIRAVRVAAMGPLGGIGDALFWFTLVPITAGITSNMAINGSIAAPFIFLLVFNLAQFIIRFFLMNWSYKLGTDAIGLLTENAKEFTRAASILGIFVVGSLTCVYGATKVEIEIPNGTTNEVRSVTAVVPASQKNKYDEYIYKTDEDGNLTDEVQDAGTDEKALGVVELPSGEYEVTFNRNQEVPVLIKIQEILDGILPQIIPLALTMILYLLLAKRGWTPLKCIGLLLILGLLGSGFGIWPSIWPS
ncbi:PTS system mannose/fructose/sorbose family transporter subunit IID [Enterococcus sp.]|uniref:PTS system mannose/fructose/sorbose family transporter subunit IID n=1 Tax=Enterococcus sp. TaxID=35783 RepID=UPI0029135E5A|nr:PTS system mannose/fructose/sorbose family transporter subunit IID [Enterococcus sp.]MDU5336013.1 PTS system mannose/fructose/sorbose family transporter subunit IID [Enterococcus sp.]